MSWAVPKGPSENPDDKRLAVHVEDHPLDYGNFEGTIPKGQYGGGTVMLWDTGTWTPHEDDVDAALKKGKLGFTLHGKRLQGNWALVRLRKRSPKDKDNWLLIKEHDEFERKSGKLTIERETSSVKSGRAMDEIAARQGGLAFEHGRRQAGRETGRAKKPQRLKKTVRRRKRLKKKDSRSRGESCRASSNRSSRRWSTHRPPAVTGCTRSSMTAIARSPRSPATRSSIRTRNGLDWTDKFQLAGAGACRTCHATARCSTARSRSPTSRATPISARCRMRCRAASGRMAYYLFDLLELDGEDLRKRAADRAQGRR